MEHLFKMTEISKPSAGGEGFSDSASDSRGPAHRLDPVDATGYTVNIVNTFPWTNSPPLIRDDDWLNPRYDIPALHLREETIQFNPALNNLARNLLNTKQGLNAMADFIKKTPEAGGLLGAVAAYRAGLLGSGSTLQDLLVLGGAAAAGATLTDDALRGTSKAIGAITTDPALQANIGPGYLKPYAGLYSTELTNFRYKLPYLSDAQRQISSGWSQSSVKEAWGGQMLENISSKMRAFSTASIALNAPGVYIDMAKTYNYGDHKSYTVDFPLINTQSQEDLVRNWQFLYLLTYQNRPNRIDRIQVAPPKIYESIIRGVWYSRFSYISKINVEFVGNRRKMTIPVPIDPVNQKERIGTGPQADQYRQTAEKYKTRAFDKVQDPDNPRGADAFAAAMRVGRHFDQRASKSLPKTIGIDTIIPDAYQVSITLTELVPESQNTMLAALLKPDTEQYKGESATDTVTNAGSAIGDMITKAML